MISLTFSLFTQVSDSGPQGPLVVQCMRVLASDRICPGDNF